MQVVDARPHIDDRTTTHRRLLPGDRGVLLEHEPALVTRRAAADRRPRRSARRPGPAAGTARPASPARASARRPAVVSAMPASTSLRCACTMRSPFARTNSAGSAPPISRCPVSRHQRRLGDREHPLHVLRRLDLRAGVRVQREREPVLLDPPLDLGEVAREPLDSRRGRAGPGADQAWSATTAATNTSAPASASTAAIRSAVARSRAPARAARAARSRRRAAARGGRAARGSPPARTAGSRSARARSRAGRATPSPRRRARDRAGRPSPGPRRRPTRSARPATLSVCSPIPRSACIACTIRAL